MISFLLLGFLIGMSHALEADHLAAVGAMAARETGGRRSLVWRGVSWGVGHTITLFALCSLVLIFGIAITDQSAAALEFGVGVMLVLLGADVLRRLHKRRIHFHLHSHDDGRAHLHAHSHPQSEGENGHGHHHHTHCGFSLKAMMVGLVHGAAGAAALLALTVATVKDPLVALASIVVFGVGSIIGMALLSLVASWPLQGIERHAQFIYRSLILLAGCVAIFIGVDIMLNTGALAWRAF